MLRRASTHAVAIVCAFASSLAFAQSGRLQPQSTLRATPVAPDAGESAVTRFLPLSGLPPQPVSRWQEPEAVPDSGAGMNQEPSAPQGQLETPLPTDGNGLPEPGATPQPSLEEETAGDPQEPGDTGSDAVDENGKATAEPGAEKDKEEAADEEKKDGESKEENPEAEPKEKAWYEKYRIRGYAQFRLNEVMDEDGAAGAQLVGDSSVGDGESFIIRRARLILQGDVTDRIGIYLQPDFAATPNGSVDAIQFVQIRDWYTDVHFTDDKTHRLRAGQSKVPYGWENLQSSQNRLPLDRNDAFNSAVRNERDLGLFYYWTPVAAQELFKHVVDEGLKGSGNYGVFGAGFYNGQGGSFREQNDNLHFITRLTVPRTLPNGQIVEASLQGYTGMYSVLSSAISPLGVGPAVRPLGTVEAGNERGIIDKRLAASFIWYPQPFGFQSEWTVGRGPALNEAQTEVIDRALYGGYVMCMYRHISACHGEFIPFLRWNLYRGGYKSERNAPYAEINEWELGLEWQFNKNLELVSMYTFTDRTNTRALSSADTLSYGQFEGDLLRLQLQVNY